MQAPSAGASFPSLCFLKDGSVFPLIGLPSLQLKLLKTQLFCEDSFHFGASPIDGLHELLAGIDGKDKLIKEDQNSIGGKIQKEILSTGIQG